MADFGSQITNYAKNEAQNFADKTVRNLAGQLSGIGGGILNSLIGSVAAGLSQNLLNIGAAFDTIEAVAAQKLDGIVAGGDPEYASGGKCADRSTVADLSSARYQSGSLKDYNLNVFPETKVADKLSTFTDSTMTVLTEHSEQYYMTLRFYKYDRKKLFKPTMEDKSLYTVHLPLPLELIDSRRTNYNTDNLETVGNIVNNTDLSAGTLSEAINNNMKNLTGTLSGAVGSGLGSTVSGIVDNVPGLNKTGIEGKAIVNVVEQYLGVAPNPNPSVMFEGPTLREFNYSWIFHPRNPEESRRIRLTINKMKASSMASTSFGQDTGLLTYPHVLIPNFHPWDNDSDVSSGIYGWGETSFIKIKRCVIEHISSNYAPNGAPNFFAETKEPTFIQLNMSLKEIEFFVASDLGGESNTAAVKLEDTINDIKNINLQDVVNFIGDGS